MEKIEIKTTRMVVCTVFPVLHIERSHVIKWIELGPAYAIFSKSLKTIVLGFFSDFESSFPRNISELKKCSSLNGNLFTKNISLHNTSHNINSSVYILV